MKPKRLPSILKLPIQELKNALVSTYGDRFAGLYLYGSYARGDFNDQSDVDLLVAIRGEVKTGREISRMGKVIAELSLKYDQLLTIYPVPASWLKDRKSPFFENVRAEGVLV